MVEVAEEGLWRGTPMTKAVIDGKRLRRMSWM